MAKPIHSMIRVLDEARSVDFYRRAFGMRVADRYDFEGFTLVYLIGEEGSFELELTINHGRTVFSAGRCLWPHRIRGGRSVGGAHPLHRRGPDTQSDPWSSTAKVR